MKSFLGLPPTAEMEGECGGGAHSWSLLLTGGTQIDRPSRPPPPTGPSALETHPALGLEAPGPPSLQAQILASQLEEGPSGLRPCFPPPPVLPRSIA